MSDQIDPGASGAWQIQEAKARFSELLRASVEDGPQTVTRRGVPLAVLVSVEQWNALRRLGAPALPTLKDLLLAPHARTAQLVPPRRHLRRRPAARLR
jgi:prevent-host-death family protein